MDGRTALHKAAAGGWARVAELLTAYGADATARDARGATAAELLARHESRRDGQGPDEGLEGAGTEAAVEPEPEPGLDPSAPVNAALPAAAADMSMGMCCPVCGNPSLLFTRFLRGGLVCLDCYSKR